MLTILTLIVSATFWLLLALLIRPQLASRFLKTVPSRTKIAVALICSLAVNLIVHQMYPKDSPSYFLAIVSALDVIALICLCILLLRPQFASKIGKAGLTRKQILLPIAGCFVVLGITGYDPSSRGSNGADESAETTESTLVGTWHCISPDHPGAPEDDESFSKTQFSFENGADWGSYRQVGSTLVLSMNARVPATGQVISGGTVAATIGHLDNHELIYTLHFRGSENTENCTR
jgi:hypothetical protein